MRLRFIWLVKPANGHTLLAALHPIRGAEGAFIMESFPIVKRKDIVRHGEYRTRRVTLEMYDAMPEASHESLVTRDA